MPYRPTYLGRLFQRIYGDTSQQVLLTLKQIGFETVCTLISRMGHFRQELWHNKLGVVKSSEIHTLSIMSPITPGTSLLTSPATGGHSALNAAMTLAGDVDLELRIELL